MGKGMRLTDHICRGPVFVYDKSCSDKAKLADNVDLRLVPLVKA